MSDSKRKSLSTTERQAALRKAGVGEELIKEVGALGEMLEKVMPDVHFRFKADRSDEFVKKLLDLQDWLGVGNMNELLNSGLAFLMTYKEGIDAGGKFCFHDKDGSIQEIDLRAFGKK